MIIDLKATRHLEAIALAECHYRSSESLDRSSLKLAKRMLAARALRSRGWLVPHVMHVQVTQARLGMSVGLSKASRATDHAIELLMSIFGPQLVPEYSTECQSAG